MTNTNSKILKVDRFITDSRLKYCLADCVYRFPEDFDCGLKQIELDEEGRCKYYKPSTNELPKRDN